MTINVTQSGSADLFLCFIKLLNAFCHNFPLNHRLTWSDSPPCCLLVQNLLEVDMFQSFLILSPLCLCFILKGTFTHSGRHLRSFYSLLSHFTVFGFTKRQSVVVSGGREWGGAEPAAVIGQQGHGLPASCSTIRPLLSRNASCLGSRPRKSLSISEASLEPPGRRMNFLSSRPTWRTNQEAQIQSDKTKSWFM